MPRRPAHWASGLNKICLSGVPAWNGEMWWTGSWLFQPNSPVWLHHLERRQRLRELARGAELAAMVRHLRFVTTPIHPPHGRYTDRSEDSGAHYRPARSPSTRTPRSHGEESRPVALWQAGFARGGGHRDRGNKGC